MVIPSSRAGRRRRGLIRRLWLREIAFPRPDHDSRDAARYDRVNRQGWRGHPSGGVVGVCDRFKESSSGPVAKWPTLARHYADISARASWMGTNRRDRTPRLARSEPQARRRPHRVAILWERLEANLGHWRADRRGQPGRGLRAVTRGAAAGPVPAAQDRGGAAGERA
jgi:hypothetical protein